MCFCWKIFWSIVICVGWNVVLICRRFRRVSRRIFRRRFVFVLDWCKIYFWVMFGCLYLYWYKLVICLLGWGCWVWWIMLICLSSCLCFGRLNRRVSWRVVCLWVWLFWCCVWVNFLIVYIWICGFWWRCIICVVVCILN